MYGDKGNDNLTDGQGYHEYSFPDSSGGDWLYGGPGHDSLDTTYGNDYSNGGPGDDRLGLTPQEADDLDTCCEPYPYDVGFDEYIGGGGNDRLAGKDFINGNDLIHGDLGSDACLGDAGDQIRGCEELVE